ncbi:MAG: NAD(P)/FAD-dependent oxidoreductase [Gemmatimonadaceae bacterium]|nr:NAD(P)/FAD-dependent oxidoreductase [Caulobacter sp.]
MSEPDETPQANAPDMAALRERYRQEKDRRASAGDRRYLDLSSDLSHLLADPYAAPVARDPVDDSVDVLVVGGGFGGLLSAARLKEAGVASVRIVEVASDVGGTWYWNRYPGAACDIESYIYFPLLEETGYMPAERYSKAPEIRAHTQRIAKHFGLYDNALFSTQVTALDWDDQAAHWVVATDRGDTIRARFVVLATGPLNKPKLAAIPGVETFKGHSFHTSRWDYDYTGGSSTTPLDKLGDKRVGVIGTGATAIQCVPPLAAGAQHLYVFQRTPSSVDARNNSPTDPAWAASLQPGWQQARMENFTAQMAGHLADEDMVADGWTVLARAIKKMFAEDQGADFGQLLERADMEKMVQVRARIEDLVEDPATAEALKPWFSLFCKRPCFHDGYLGVFNQPNVTLVDTAGRGVEKITETGVVVAGREYPLDCLVFATGFEVGGDFAKRSGFDLRGVDGQSLSDKWAQGPATYHGMHSRGFPNCFIISQAQSGMSPNFPHMLSEQAKHLAHIIGHCVQTGVATVEASAQAQDDWVDQIVQTSADRIRKLETCTPGYYNNEGRPSMETARALPHGAGPVMFIDMLRQWRESGDFAGLELDGAPVRAKESV